MAWRSSGTSNESMVDNLKRFGVVRTSPVEASFRAVDRRFFVPQNQVTLAHSDQPLRDGHVHISAPHIYGTALEALEFEPNSSQSFLNLGSGTGYLSCMVASLLGPNSVHVAVDVCLETLQHAHESIARWKTATGAKIPPIEMIHGNALYIDPQRGEAISGFDRIYMGATVERSKLNRIARLLRPGGILVGPVDDDLVKVLRVSDDLKPDVAARIPRTTRGHPPLLSSDYSVQVLSGVRFASLVESPQLATVLPSRVWTPSEHQRYPGSFRSACKEILLCAGSQYEQPIPPQRRNPVNAASILPRALWMEVFSYTTRDWFDKPRNSEDLLRRRLQEEQNARREAEEARLRAEERLAMMERERDLYKTLALRWQARLRSVLGDDNEVVQEEALLLAGDELPRLLTAAASGYTPVNFFRAFRGRISSFARRNAMHDSESEDEEGDAEDVGLEETSVANDDDTDSSREEDMEDASEGQQEGLAWTEVEANSANWAETSGETNIEEHVSTSGQVGRQQQVRTVSMSESDF